MLREAASFFPRSDVLSYHHGLVKFQIGRESAQFASALTNRDLHVATQMPVFLGLRQSTRCQSRPTLALRSVTAAGRRFADQHRLQEMNAVCHSHSLSSPGRAIT